MAKLFIADDLLLQEAKGQIELTAADRQSLDTMLRSSDDSAAEVFWNRSGGNNVITRVAARYRC
ncbi:serine hydrolase [Mycolicibacterium aubagnense]